MMLIQGWAAALSRFLCKSFLLGSFIFFAALRQSEAGEKVHAIRRNSTIILDSGKSLRLAGVTLPSESIPVLTTLMSKKEIVWEACAECSSGIPSSAKEPVQAFIYVAAPERDMPFDPLKEPRTKTLMVNEFLIETGSATVEAAVEFPQKQKFLELQEQARKKGYGVWSYQPYEKKSKPTL